MIEPERKIQLKTEIGLLTFEDRFPKVMSCDRTVTSITKSTTIAADNQEILAVPAKQKTRERESKQQ